MEGWVKVQLLCASLTLELDSTTTTTTRTYKTQNLPKKKISTKKKKRWCDLREFLESCPSLRFVPRSSVAALDGLPASTTTI